MSENTGCGSARFDEDDLYAPVLHVAHADVASAYSDDDRFSPNIDLRYGGQYMTAEQLPTFCDQLHHLVEVVRNIQSYAQVTGEYPAELEKRLEREAHEVAALAAEMRNAHEVIQRTRIQRRALRDHKTQLQEQLASLKETEIRELESTVRLSDRKMYKSWEVLKDAVDPAAYNTLLDEIRTKKTALECLLRLIDGRRATLLARPTMPQPLPPPMPKDSSEESSTNAIKKRHERRANKRRRNKEPRSVPVSSEPSAHAHLPQVTLYIQGSETGARRSSVPLAPLELPSGGSVRDILFFTANTV